MIADRKKQWLISTGCWMLIAVLLLFTLFPLGWVLSTSLKSRGETFASPPYFIPHSPTFESYISMWESLNFKTYFLNSMIVALCTTVLCLTVANLAAYGFSRFRLKFGTSLLMFILVSQMIPSVLFVIPYFIMIGKVGLLNTKLALIIAHTSFALPFSVWMLKGYYEAIPQAVDEAAMIDGCTRTQALLRIVFPLSIPGNMATLIFAFMQSWNEYLFAMSLVTKDKMYTVPVGIAMFMGEYQTAWNELMAASLAASVPIIIVYLIVDKYLVGGLTAGAVRS